MATCIIQPQIQDIMGRNSESCSHHLLEDSDVSNSNSSFDGSNPDDSSCGDSSPVDSSCGDSSPADSSCGDSSPVDSSCGDSSPVDSSCGDSSPADSGFYDSSPVDSSCYDSSPVGLEVTGQTPRDQPMGEFMRSRKETEYTDLPQSCFPPEIEEGKVEYKLELVSPSPNRFEHLVTQMKWRLKEGGGEAIYEIGVQDCGTFIGLHCADLKSSLKTLSLMADRLGASLTTLREFSLTEGRKVVEVLVRKVPDDQEFLDLRIAVLGNADCGKSTLVGVLAHDELDNGRGRARLNLFRHRHEIQSGRTSSISQEIIGFDSKGELVNYGEHSTAEDICDNSSKIIHFIDVPGHQKYLKTTIFGLMGHSPHFALLAMSANTGVVGTTREQLGFAMCLQVPIFVVVTKVDCTRPSVLEKNLTHMESLLQSPGCNKVPMRVNSTSDAVTAATKLNTDSIVPIFKVSNKTGVGLDLLRQFINVLPPTASVKELDRLTTHENLLFRIDDVFCDVPDVGLVTSGVVKRGCIKEGEVLLMGPQDDGSFTQVKVTSMHRNRFACRLVKAGQAAGIALAPSDTCGSLPTIRKGMVLVSPDKQPKACWKFRAKIKLLFHRKSIKKGFQCTVHVANIRQTAEIVNMSTDALETNGETQVVFKFLRHPECVDEGMQLLFRQGSTRGKGVIKDICVDDSQLDR